jgi:hypothetical protein
MCAEGFGFEHPVSCPEAGGQQPGITSQKVRYRTLG